MADYNIPQANAPADVLGIIILILGAQEADECGAGSTLERRGDLLNDLLVLIRRASITSRAEIRPGRATGSPANP